MQLHVRQAIVEQHLAGLYSLTGQAKGRPCAAFLRLRGLSRLQARQPSEQGIEAVTGMELDAADLLDQPFQRLQPSLSRSSRCSPPSGGQCSEASTSPSVSSCPRIRFTLRPAPPLPPCSPALGFPGAELGDRGARLRDACAHIVAQLRIQRRLRRQHLVQPCEWRVRSWRKPTPHSKAHENHPTGRSGRREGSALISQLGALAGEFLCVVIFETQSARSCP